MQHNGHNSKNHTQDHISIIHYGTHESRICPAHEISDHLSLRWNRHIADITGRADKLLGLLRLRRKLSTCDRRVKEAAYLGLVRPLIEYASQAWDPFTDNLSNEIERMKRRAARFITSDYQNCELGSVTKFLKNLG